MRFCIKTRHMQQFNKTFLVVFLFLFSFSQKSWATGEPSTYFNIFVPPNADAVQRNVCLVVTAIFDSTNFTIVDDSMDGDNDDNKSGMLMAGQSYILYIKDNGINDDAQYASGGTLKRDGDYFIIQADKNIYASQSTNSDWQHDWVPGISQSSLSQKFIVYAPKVSSSKRDINAFAYEDSTYVTLKRISSTPTIVTGYTNVDYQGGTVVFQKMINRGQDLIHFYADARNILDDGHTYIIEASKPITLQYGALYGNERDGGGYVPTNSGSSSGSQAYFCVPYQAVGEQEIRVVSWDAGNNVKLYRYSAGSWIQMTNWTMNEKSVQEWVGKNNGNVSYATVFKVECTAGKRVSVFEGNWFETGTVGTSDMATMMSAENGTSSGNYFLAYMAPPGNEANVFNPFTNSFFGGKFTHLYIFSQDTAHVQVKDAYTNGTDFTRSYTILPGRYVDCAMSETEWRAIYNGTGTIAGGPERPYLIVTSDNHVSVMNTNFNDNWMMYFGSSQFQSFKQTTTSTSSVVTPGQSLNVISNINVEGTSPVTNASAQIIVDGGLVVNSSNFVDVTNHDSIPGNITQNASLIIIQFDSLPNLSPTGNYQIVTELSGKVMDASGNPIPNNSVSDITTNVNGIVNGKSMQSTSLESVALNSYNTTGLIFDFAENTGLESLLTDSWTASTIDYDNDGDDDLFFTDQTSTQSNKLYRNNGNGTFTLITTGNIATDMAKSMASAWADYDNDGDLDVVVANNTQKANFFYENNGNGTFTKNTTAAFVKNVGYYHHVSWMDVDNDGVLELYLGNYWPTRLNELYKKDASGNWSLWSTNLLSQITGSATGATWCDYDNDGYQDLLILNNEGGNNRMYHNKGNGNFEVVTNDITSTGGKSVASTWGDIDNDGDMDLFIANASNLDNDLFINNGGGDFSLVTIGEIVNDKGHSHGPVFADVDKDMDLDLYVSNDQGLKFLYMNNGLGEFTKKTDEWPSSNFGKSYGSSFSDLDLDGDLDLVVATHSNQRNYLFTANNNSNKWIGIRLVGTKSNHSAIGAKIHVKCNGKWQMREVNSQNGLGGQSSYRQHFGLANASIIDSIEIEWPSGYIQKLASINTNQNMVITEPNGSEVKLTAYYDANNNCTKDAGELLLENIAFTINGDQFNTYTNQNGEAHIFLANGNYTIDMSSSDYHTTCTSTSSFSVDTIGSIIDLGNYPLQANCTHSNLKMNVVSTTMRRGFDSKYVLEVSNVGIESSSNGVLTATLPTSLNLLNASIPWDTRTVVRNEQTVTWNIGTMEYTDALVINLFYNVTLSLMPDDEITATFNISGDAEECDAVDNSFVDYQTIFGSFDPNDIQVYPTGLNELHLISNKQELTYKIRFQNVGNYMADFVTIIDTLPSELDIKTIRKISSSHKYQISTKGNVIIFSFPNILLPDSSSNMDGSNGYIQFTVAQKANNKGGSKIMNHANIRFDYNEVIATNSVFNTLFPDDHNYEDGQLVVFPNPATDIVTLKPRTDDTYLTTIVDVQLFSMDGNSTKYEITNSSMPTLNVSKLNSGTYLVLARDKNGKKYTGKMIKK